MSLPETDLKETTPSSLVYVRQIEDLWNEGRGNFFDEIVGSKGGVWADCKAHIQVYFKTVHLDRNGEPVLRSYRRIDGHRVVVRLSELSVRDIERYGSAVIAHAGTVAVETKDNHSQDPNFQSVNVISPLQFIFNYDHISDIHRVSGRIYCTTERSFVFAEKKFGENPKYTEKSLDEVQFNVGFENLRIFKNDYMQIFKICDEDVANLKNIISARWISQSLIVLNKVAFKYRRHHSDGNKNYKSKEAIKKDLKSRWSITNNQKLDSAFDIVSGAWTFHRKGIFGKPEDGKLTLLEAVNRLAEIDFDAKENGRCRKEYTDGRPDEKSEMIFENRANGSLEFKDWIRSELGIYNKRNWEALYKHISEFIRK